MDGRILTFAFVVTLATAILSGLIPAMRGAAAAVRGTLRERTHAAAGSSGRARVRRALVAIEVAMGVVLVLGAGLTIRGFHRLVSVEPGFNPAGLLMANVAPPPADYRTAEQVEQFYTALIERLKAAPGVTSVSAATTVPLWSDAGVWDFEIEGQPKPGKGQMAWNAAAVVARPGLLETLGVPMKRGRFFRPSDDMHAMTVAVISEAMAETFFSHQDPIGRRMRVTGVTAPEGWMTIVGVAADIRDQALDMPPRPTYYLAHSQVPALGEGPYRAMSIVMRVGGRPDPAVDALRNAVRELDPRLPVFDVQPLDAILNQSVARPRFTTVLIGLFAGIGILLGASGIYGVLAYSVARRTSEIGIRRALGAPAPRLVREIVGAGLQPVAVGLAAGLIASFWTTRVLTTELFGVSRTDPATYALTVVAIVCVALVSCLVPARRALRVSPLAALRSE